MFKFIYYLEDCHVQDISRQYTIGMVPKMDTILICIC